MVDIREGIAKLGDLWFNVLDSAGIETEVSSGTILGRTTAMTANVLSRTPLDMEVGKWLRKHAPQIKPIVVMNKSESLGASLAEVGSETLALAFGEPTAISAETGLGMMSLYEVLRPLLEDYMVETFNDDVLSDENHSDEIDESKLPLQLAIVGRPNVGKSTLLNAVLEEERVLVGPEAGLTRDAVRVQFEFQSRTAYMVMSRHSWKDSASQPKIKFFTQVKARPPTFVAFLTGKTQLLESDVRFLTRSLKEDFDLGGTPIGIIQRAVPRSSPGTSSVTGRSPGGRVVHRTTSGKRTFSV